MTALILCEDVEDEARALCRDEEGNESSFFIFSRSSEGKFEFTAPAFEGIMVDVLVIVSNGVCAMLLTTTGYG